MSSPNWCAGCKHVSFFDRRCKNKKSPKYMQEVIPSDTCDEYEKDKYSDSNRAKNDRFR